MSFQYPVGHAPIERLATELHENIAQYLPSEDYLAFSLSSRTLHNENVGSLKNFPTYLAARLTEPSISRTSETVEKINAYLNPVMHRHEKHPVVERLFAQLPKDTTHVTFLLAPNDGSV